MKKNSTNHITYIVMGFIALFAICVIGVNIYKANLYNTKKSIITTIIPEVLAGELNNVLLERPNVVLYLSSGQNQTIKKFESKLKTFIINNSLQDEMIYINLDNGIDLSEYYSGEYHDLNFLLFKDGHLTSTELIDIEDAKIKNIYNYLVSEDVIDNNS